MSTSDRERVVPLARESLPVAAWSATVVVRFGHCDPAGIVFTPRYFDILNEAVERFFVEALAIDYYALVAERRLGLGYASAACAFLRPNRMGERLEVVPLVAHIGTSSYTLLLPVMKGGHEVARGRLVTVTTSLDTMTPCPIPDDVRAALERYRALCQPMPDLA